MPSVAEDEWDENRDLVLEVLKWRGYAQAKRRYDDACEHGGNALRRALADPAVKRVQDVEFELVEAERDGPDVQRVD